jgi:O-antigen ligase
MQKIKLYFFGKESKLNKLTFIFIAFLPLSLFLGSAIINTFVLLSSTFFILEILKRKTYYNNQNNIFLLSFFIISLILNSIFISKVPIESLERSLGTIRFLILIMALRHIIIFKKYKYEQLLYKIWFIIFIITTLDLIFEYCFGHNTLGFKSYMSGRLSGFLNQELKIGNYYYGFILFAISYLVYNFKNKISIILFCTFLFTSLIIGERANFIRTFIMICIFFFLIEKNRIKRIISITLFIVVVILAFNSQTTKERFSQALGAVWNENREITKSLLNTQYGSHYYAAIKIFEENKIFGIGIRNFRYVSGDPKFQDTNNESVWSKHSWAPHPHQYHFEFLSETGIVGYLIFIFTFFYLIFKSIINYRKNNNLYQLSAILFVVTSLIPIIPTGSFFSPFGATIFWLNCAIMLAYNKSK